MKRATSVIGIVTLATLALVTSRAEWKLISIMRGEPESTTPQQRVAFVGSAVVKTVEGKAERLCGIDCWAPISSGTQLKVGDLVRTGKGAVVLKMDDSQSFVKVAPNTVLRLIPLEESWDRAVLTGCEEQQGFTVRSCRGSAFYRAEMGDWKPILVNSVLPDSSIIRTEPQTTLDLYCPTARRPIRIAGQKELKLAEITTPQSSRISFAAINP